MSLLSCDDVELVKAGEPHLLQRNTLKQAFEALPVEQQQLLTRTADRIRRFAGAHCDSPLAHSCLAFLYVQPYRSAAWCYP
jgi:hypothetical protein